MMVESPTPSDGGLYNYSLLLSATIGIISSACCFYFVLKKLKINHIIKKLLLFASIQQCLGYGILFSSMMLFIFKIKNKGQTEAVEYMSRLREKIEDERLK